MKKKIKNIILASALALGIGSIAAACSTTEQIKYVDVPGEDTIIENPIDSLNVNTPAYTWERQAAFGENPDLDNVLIDGKATEGEGWENQKYYQVATSESPYVNFRISTQFSDKGLYVYALCNDGAKIAWSGRNYMFRNSNFNIFITSTSTTVYNTEQVKSIKVDKNNMYPAYTRVKVAINTEPGEGSTPDKFGIEMFLTWEELRIKSRPDKIKIYPAYSYQYSSSDVLVTQLAAPFAGGSGDLNNYITFDKDGYTNGDAEGAAVGDSFFGLGKTIGWDISQERAANPSVSTTSTSSQAIFFTNELGRNFSIETEVDVSQASGNGSAGLVFFIANNKYLTFTVNKTDQTANSSGFTKLESRMRFLSGNSTRLVDFKTIEASGNARLKIIYIQGKLYFILNDELVHCETNNNLSDRMSPGLLSLGLNNARFVNYAANAYTRDEVTAETLNYAYGLSGTADRNLSVSFSTEAVNKDASTNSVDVTVSSARQLSISTSDFATIFAGRDGNEEKYDEALEFIAGRLFKIGQINKTVSKLVDGHLTTQTTDITNDYKENAVNGVYTMTGIDGDTVLEVKQTNPTVSDLAVLTFDLVDESTKKKITSNPSITVQSKNNGLAAKYVVLGRGGRGIVFVEKGYEYSISVACSAYRTANIDLGLVTASASINDSNVTLNDGTTMMARLMTPTKFGGTASCADPSKSALSLASSSGTWDYSHESEGYALFECQKNSSGIAYFSGYTVDKCQVAEFTVRNTTNAANYDRVEPDPAVGFSITTAYGGAFIGFRYGGLRVLPDTSYWSAVQYECGLGQTVNLVNNLPYAGTCSLRMIRIEENCYMFARKDSNPWQYIAFIPLNKRRSGGYAGIGLNVTSSYGMSLTLSDYDIRCGFSEVETAALAQFAAKLELGDTCFEDGDPTKPLITLSGMYDYDPDDGVDNNMVFAGNEFTVTLNRDNCNPEDLANKLYIVKLGNQEVYLSGASTSSDPSATITLAEDNIGKKTVTIEKVNNATVSGKIKLYKNNEDITGTLDLETLQSIKGYAISQASGAKVPFDIVISGDEGNYELSYVVKVKARDNYLINAELAGYACEQASVKSGSTGSVKEVEKAAILHDMPIGGSATFGGRQFVGSVGEESFGFDNITYGITGPYLEVKGSSGNNWHVFNDAPLSDFVIKYSYFRVSVSAQDEADPGVGLFPTNGSISEYVMFLRNGVRILPYGSTWATRIEQTGLSSTNLQDTSGAKYDFMFIRRGSTYYMYSKPSSASNYTLVYTYTSKQSLGQSAVELVFTATSSRDYHYFVYNIDVQPIGATVPETAIRNVTFTDAGTHTITGAHKDADNNPVFVVGDNITVGIVPPAGKLVAYAKVNGKFANVTNNQFRFVVTADTNVEIAYEDAYEERQITGTVKYVDGLDKTLNNVNLTFELKADGRLYTFDRVQVSNGSFSVKLREGEFYAYAAKDTMASKKIDVTVDAEGAHGLDIVLDVYNQGTATVNGTSLSTNNPYTSDRLHTEGGLQVPGRSGNSMYTYLPDTVTSSNYFYVETKIKMSGGTAANVNDPYFTNDHVTGIALENGNTRIAFLFWNDGLRICNGGWSNAGYMLKYGTGGAAYFEDANPTVRTHKIGIANYDDVLYVLLDDVLVLKMDAANGVETYSGSINISTGNESANNNLKAIVGEVLSGECCVSYGANINMAISSNYNKALFYDTVFTTDMQIAKAKANIGD